MHPVRKQRLIAVMSVVVGVSVAAALAFLALGENMDHFYTPSDIAEGNVEPGTRLRVGGLVVEGSVNRDPQTLQVAFAVSDTAEQVFIEYNGILPDLFREGQGIVAVGRMGNNGRVAAEQVLAKHDENYMPPEVQDAIEKAGHPAGKTYSANEGYSDDST